MLLLLVIVSILLALPAVQTKLGNKLTSIINKDFDVDIAVNRVDLSNLGAIQLKEILIKNHHKDTLVYVDNLSTSIFSYRNILNNKMAFDEVELHEFYLNIKRYKGEADDALSIFSDKFDDEEPREGPSDFLLNANWLKFYSGRLDIVDEEDPNDKPMFFSEITGTTGYFEIAGPDVSAAIKKLRFKERDNLDIHQFSSDFKYTKTGMQFGNTSIETENSRLEADFIMSYAREDLSDFNNKVLIIGQVIDAEIATDDLHKMYEEFGKDEQFNFSTTVNGTLNELNLESLTLTSKNGAVVSGNFKLNQLLNEEAEFSIDADIGFLSTNHLQLKKMLPELIGDNLPPIFEKFGQFEVQGATYLTSNLINSNIQLNTDIGNAQADIELSNINEIDDASYVGSVKIEDFNLGHIVNDSLIGLLSLEADVEGEGLIFDNLNTTIVGTINKHQYKGYTYNNISINGLVQNKRFDGEMEVNDENIKLNFVGLADLSEDVYSFDFKTNVDYCDLNTINLFKRDSISNIKGEIDINVRGNSFDDLVGTVQFKNSLYSNQKDNYFFKDFNVTSSFTDSIRTITVNSSEIIDGRLRGKFKFNELGKLTQNSIGSIYTNYEPFEVSSGQELDFRFNIYNKIIEVFYPEITLSANTLIDGDINSDENLFRLNIKSPSIIAYNNEINNVNLQINNKSRIYNTLLTIDKINSPVYDISTLRLANINLKDSLHFVTSFKGGEHTTEDFSLNFYHTFNDKKQSVFGIKKSRFTLKDKIWAVNPSNNLKNKVVYDGKAKSYDIENIDISSADQKIEFHGIIKDSLQQDLNFYLKDVQLANITRDIDSLSLKGLVNGEINYNKRGKIIKPSGNLSISDFDINDSYQGDLNMNVTGRNSFKLFDVDISLESDIDKDGKKERHFSALGALDFNPERPTMDLNVNFEEFKLNAFSPLGEDVFSNIRGYAYGDVKLTGFIDNPTMEGDLFLDQAGLYFPYLNIDYDFAGTSIINLKDQTFNFEDVTLQDKLYNTRGSLTGTLTHDHFKEWVLDLNLNTANLLVLNTEQEETSLYYGSGYVEGGATIKGPTDKLVIDVEGKTKKGTHLVIPISDVKTVESSQSIRFVGANDLENSIENRKAFISEKLKGLSMNFNIEVTKDAVVEMVLDQSTGSYLRGSGTGNLQLSLDTKNKFDMYGDFVVDNGIYNFKYSGINKPFIVRKGGSISWSGDPYTADIDIEAIYRVSANPRSLLENITANRKIPIDLITRFSGELFNSEKEFDIEIPNSSSTVASELEFKLNSNDGNSKTVHFISLLVSGSFYNESNLSVNSNAALLSTMSDMLSNAFDNIFNQGDSRFKLKPVYTVGEKNKVDNINIDDQLALALDYQVNDKILINGRVGVPVGSKEQSNVIGEVKVEFLMNDEGTLRSSVFNRQNEIQYTEEEEGYTQGVGMSYQIDFDNGRELLEKLRLKKKNVKDSVQNTKLDSLKLKQKNINFKNKQTTKNE